MSWVLADSGFGEEGFVERMEADEQPYTVAFADEPLGAAGHRWPRGVAAHRAWPPSWGGEFGAEHLEEGTVVGGGSATGADPTASQWPTAVVVSGLGRASGLTL